MLVRSRGLLAPDALKGASPVVCLGHGYVEFNITGSEEGRTQQWVRPIRHRRPRQRQALALVHCCSEAVADRSGSDGQVAAWATNGQSAQSLGFRA